MTDEDQSLSALSRKLAVGLRTKAAAHKRAAKTESNPQQRAVLLRYAKELEGYARDVEKLTRDSIRTFRAIGWKEL